MYDDETIEALREQLRQAAEIPFYGRRFEAAGVDPEEVDSYAALGDVPFTTAADVHTAIEEHPPDGTLGAESGMLAFQPIGDERAPVFDSAADLDAAAEVQAYVFESIGVSPGDRVVVSFGYHGHGNGYLNQRGLDEVGAQTIPLGPGDPEEAAEVIRTFDVEVLLGTPAYALDVAEAGAEVDAFLSVGAPFSVVPGLRARVSEALGGAATGEYYGTRRVAPAALLPPGAEQFRVVDDHVVVEVVDPDTGEQVDPGGRGEVVLTNLNKEGMPLVRYRTGDVADVATDGDDVVLPDGVVGGIDDRFETTHGTVYPGVVGAVLFGFESLSGAYRVEVVRPGDEDRLRVVCEGSADHEALHDHLAGRLSAPLDEVVLVDDLPDGPLVVDRRDGEAPPRERTISERLRRAVGRLTGDR